MLKFWLILWVWLVSFPLPAQEKAPTKGAPGLKVERLEALVLVAITPTALVAALDKTSDALKESNDDLLKGRLNWFQDTLRELSKSKAQGAAVGTRLIEPAGGRAFQVRRTVKLGDSPLMLDVGSLFAVEYMAGSDWMSSLLLKDLFLVDAKAHEKTQTPDEIRKQSFQLQAKILLHFRSSAQKQGSPVSGDLRTQTLLDAYAKGEGSEEWNKYIESHSEGIYLPAHLNVSKEEQLENKKAFLPALRKAFPNIEIDLIP